MNVKDILVSSDERTRVRTAASDIVVLARLAVDQAACISDHQRGADPRGRKVDAQVANIRDHAECMAAAALALSKLL